MRVLTLVLAWLLAASTAEIAVWAQNVPAVPLPGAVVAEQSRGADRFVLVPPDRRTRLLLGHAQALIDQGRFSEAVRCLGRILQGAEDFFYRPDRSAAAQRSLKAEAQRMLEDLPRRGLELYRLQYGPRAQTTLNEAVAGGDTLALAEVARHHFHTAAGYEATLLLGLYHLDQGRPIQAALTLQRLRESARGIDRFEPTLSVAMAVCWLRAGMPDDAVRVLVDLQHRSPGCRVMIGGREVALFDDPSKALPWLVSVIGEVHPSPAESSPDWLMPHGNASRNAAIDAGGPLLNMQWRVPTTDRPDVETLIESLQRQQQQDARLLPGLHPLVVDDLVLMRTAKNLLAVDCRTGKRIWDVPADDPFEAFLNPSKDTATSRRAQLELGLRLRLWGDATYGTLCSDGDLVFVVEGLGLNMNPTYARMIAVRGREVVGGPKSYNRLAAYDVRSGELRWEVGSSPKEDGLPLAGTFFLGPPLPLMDNLYVVAETDGEIRLLALEAKSGIERWRQPLSGGDRNILLDPLRRLSGVSPSYADGILICPTSNHSIVALELATRLLLWGYCYNDEDRAGQPWGVPFAAQMAKADELSNRWLDSSVVLVDGHVLITPVDSNQLHCLDLTDGRLLWQHPRGEDHLYLACVHEGNVVLVGRTAVRALRLADGQPAWQGQPAVLPEGHPPSGIGFASNGRYYLPLARGQMATIDLDSGQVLRISKSRDRIALGNLVCYKDKIISQRADAVEAYWQLDALRRQVQDSLAANPQDAVGLSLEGEICWADGKLRQAISAFRQSLAASDTPATRYLFREALFEGLQAEFPGYRDREAEIESLLEWPEERAVFLRLMAVGLVGQGQYREALDYYRRLISLDTNHPGMEELDLDWSIRRDRWIQLQLAHLWRDGPPRVRPKMDELVEDSFKQAVASGSIESLQSHLNYFGRLPAGRQAEKPLADKLLAAGRLLESELLWMRQLRRVEAEEAAAVLARWADMLRQARRWDDAAKLYARLGSEFADTRCLQGRTGREWIEALPADGPVARRLDGGSVWPVGAVMHKIVSATKTARTAFGRAEIQYQGVRDPFFSDVSVEINQAPVQLVGRNGFGNSLWNMTLDKYARLEHFAFSRTLMRVSVSGHLLLVSLGDKILALDTLDAETDSPPRVVWTHDLHGADSQKWQEFMQGIHRGNPPFPGGRPVGLGVNSAVAMGEGLICVRRFRDLIGIDPATGRTLWVRRNVPLASMVFGDPEYVFIVPPDSTQAMVLSAQHGKLLGQRAVPARNQCFATLGRMILRRCVEPLSISLELIDPWQPEAEQTVWGPRRFNTGTKIVLLDRQAVAVYEPNGHFVLLKLADGTPIIDQQLEADTTSDEIIVFRMGQQYLLIVNQRTTNDRRRLYSLHVASRRIGRAKVYGFGPDGEKLWPRPVVVEEQFLPLNQPRQLPVLTFACMAQENRSNGRTRTETSILCVDTRTGRVVCRQRFPNRANRFQISGNPEKQTVEIVLDRKAIELTFTDRPLSEMQDLEAAESGPPKTPIMAIWDALFKAARGLPPEPDDGAARDKKVPPTAQRATIRRPD